MRFGIWLRVPETRPTVTLGFRFAGRESWKINFCCTPMYTTGAEKNVDRPSLWSYVSRYGCPVVFGRTNGPHVKKQETKTKKSRLKNVQRDMNKHRKQETEVWCFTRIDTQLCFWKSIRVSGMLFAPSAVDRCEFYPYPENKTKNALRKSNEFRRLFLIRRDVRN